MSKPLLLLSCLAAGAAGGVLTLVLFDGRAVEPARPAPSPGVPGVDARLETRLEDLERQIQGLAAGQSVLADQLQARARETVQEVGAPPAQPPAKNLYAALDGDPGFDALVEARVQSVIDAREDAERQERETREAQRREEWTKARVARIAEELGLTEFQQGEMTRILNEENAQRSKVFQDLRDSGSFDREAVSASMREINAKTEVELSTVLTPDQLSRYQEMDDDGPRFFGGGRRGNG